MEFSRNNYQENIPKTADQNAISSCTNGSYMSTPNPNIGTHISSPNVLSSQTDDIIEDPLSHIQWPKSAYQPDGNYTTDISPYSTSAITQNLHEFNYQ